MTSLLERIGNRTVLVDACVTPRLAKALRKAGLSVRHMNEINPRMPDAHIEILVLEPTDVLITHDRMFARFLGPRKAILLRQDEASKIRYKNWFEVIAGDSCTKSGITVALLLFLSFFYCVFKKQIVNTAMIAGQSRSPAIAIGVLMKKYNMDFYAAYNFVTEKVPIAQIEPCHISKLKKLFNVGLP